MTGHISETSETESLLGSTATDEPTKPSPFQVPKWLLRHFDRYAINFGVRMSVCLTVSSLFVLAQIPGDKDGFRQGMWVLITVLFVCWFPSGDVASVLEKSVQRLMGTLVGAALGLACGFLSLEVEKVYGIRAQALCLGICIALVTFIVCSYAAARVGQARLIESKNYATILCILTFAICLMPFYSIDDKPWEKSMYRIINVIIGCFLGVILSMLVFPRPTASILQDKITKQIELAGEASLAVLHTAADAFADETYFPSADMYMCRSVRKRLPSTSRHWRDAESDYAFDYGHDAVLEKYEAAMKEYRATMAQLRMLKYDPFNIGRPNDLLTSFRNEVAQAAARAMRIQTTVVLIDGIVRNDPYHKFSEEHLVLLANVGTLIRNMLSVPLNIITSDATERKLSINLVQMRQMIVDLSATVSASPEVQIPSIVSQNGKRKFNMSGVNLAGIYGRSSNNLASLVQGQLHDDNGGKGAPKHVPGSLVCSLLFLQLAEHLALRSVRLYQSWKQYEEVCQLAESLKSSAM